MRSNERTDPKTVPSLLAMALGLGHEDGAERCRYCGVGCAPENGREAERWVKKTTTTHQYFRAPTGRYVCRGCEYALRWKETTVPLFGGEREGTRACMYSWVITGGGATAFTKAHVPQLRGTCLDPPSPPFAVVLAVSGQKHLLYLGHVNLARDPVRVLLEDEPVTYSTESLADRLDLSSKVCAATGKPTLADCEPWRLFRSCADRYADGVEIADKWMRVRSEPLSRLAAFLTDRKEVCCGLHPETA